MVWHQLQMQEILDPGNQHEQGHNKINVPREHWWAYWSALSDHSSLDSYMGANNPRYYMWTVKTDQTVQMCKLIWVFTRRLHWSDCAAWSKCSLGAFTDQTVQMCKLIGVFTRRLHWSDCRCASWSESSVDAFTDQTADVQVDLSLQ